VAAGRHGETGEASREVKKLAGATAMVVIHRRARAGSCSYDIARCNSWGLSSMDPVLLGANALALTEAGHAVPG
jgi:hypothetical protein